MEEYEETVRTPVSRRDRFRQWWGKRRRMYSMVGMLVVAGMFVAITGWHIQRLEARLLTLESRAGQGAVVSNRAISDAQFTDIVAQVAPTVVSIAVKKEVPRMEIRYIEPFKNRDLGFRIPVYDREGTEEREVGVGTGFLVSSDGYILTNRHVVEERNARYTVVLSDGQEKAAEIVALDKATDIALLKISGQGYPYARMGSSSDLQLGQSVFAIGNALGEYRNSVSVGIISGLDRDVEAVGDGGVKQLQGVIQTDAAINRGNSGGPLMTLSGEVIGVTVAFVSGSQNIAFAIPIDDARDVVTQASKRIFN